jgi:hypothetical protein
MGKLRSTLALLCVVAAPVAAAPLFNATPDLCFASGLVTYRLSANAPAPDYRVAIDNQAPHPDMRIRLVDRVESADFALTDDAGTLIGSACKSAGPIRTVRIVPAGAPADIVVAVSPREGGGDFSLYVHSARVSHFDAAALFALVRHAPDTDHALDGAPDYRAAAVR